MMEEPSWQIYTTIPGDDVMAEDGLTFLLLHIGNRIQSSTCSTMHKCFLFQSIEDGGGDLAEQQSFGSLIFCDRSRGQ
jgi:hypothetical protein